MKKKHFKQKKKNMYQNHGLAFGYIFHSAIHPTRLQVRSLLPTTTQSNGFMRKDMHMLIKLFRYFRMATLRKYHSSQDFEIISVMKISSETIYLLSFKLPTRHRMSIIRTYLWKNYCLPATSIHRNTPSLLGIWSKIFSNKLPPKLNIVILHKE